jgi:hypothetical protein
MSFYCPFAIMSVMDACRMGEWKADLACTPCPIGMRCVDGLTAEECPFGTASVAPGASRCCDGNTTCPPGNAVAPDTCECVPFPCPLVRVGRELHCADAVVDGDTPCAKCGKGYAIDKGCACARVSDGNWWRASQNRFVCFIIKN